MRKTKRGIKKTLKSKMKLGQSKSMANVRNNEKDSLNSECEEGGDPVLGWDGKASKLRHGNQVVQA